MTRTLTLKMITVIMVFVNNFLCVQTTTTRDTRTSLDHGKEYAVFLKLPPHKEIIKYVSGVRPNVQQLHKSGHQSSDSKGTEMADVADTLMVGAEQRLMKGAADTSMPGARDKFMTGATSRSMAGASEEILAGPADKLMTDGTDRTMKSASEGLLAGAAEKWMTGAEGRPMKGATEGLLAGPGDKYMTGATERTRTMKDATDRLLVGPANKFMTAETGRTMKGATEGLLFGPADRTEATYILITDETGKEMATEPGKLMPSVPGRSLTDATDETPEENDSKRISTHFLSLYSQQALRLSRQEASKDTLTLFGRNGIADVTRKEHIGSHIAKRSAKHCDLTHITLRMVLRYYKTGNLCKRSTLRFRFGVGK